MFAKPEWFGRRKYTGWGLTPKTWQGWAYIGVIIVPIAALEFLTFLTAGQKMGLSLGWAAFMAIDILDTMAHMKKDEREERHEAIAERNAAWMMVAALTAGIAYQAASSIAAGGQPSTDPFLLVALFAGLAAKAITNWKLSREN